MNSYLIFGSEYKHNSGGSKALNVLAQDLLVRGFDVVVSKNRSDLSDDCVVVYPERVSGNPLNAKKYVRWMLHRKDYFDKIPRKYEKNDVFFYFDSMLGSPVLFVPTIESDIQKRRQESLRDLTVVYVGKGCIPESFDTRGMIVCTRDFPKERSDFLKILYNAKVVHCFDSFTSVWTESTLLGAYVIYHTNGDFTRDQYESSELGLNGVAWGESYLEIERAKNTVIKRNELYRGLCDKSVSQVDHFVKITQKL